MALEINVEVGFRLWLGKHQTSRRIGIFSLNSNIIDILMSQNVSWVGTLLLSDSVLYLRWIEVGENAPTCVCVCVALHVTLGFSC